jgi:hypothetical protein
MADPAPAGQFQADLNIGYGKAGVSEKYMLTASTVVLAQQFALTLCQLRTFFFGSGVVIDKCSVSDLKRNRNSLPVPVAGLGCPYNAVLNPTPQIVIDAPNDPAVGFLYRFQAPKTVNGQITGWFENRLLRMIPDVWENNDFIQIPAPNGIQSAGPVPAYPGPVNYNIDTIVNNTNGALLVPYDSLITAYAGCNAFLAFLVNYTCYVSSPYTAQQGPNVPWQNVFYYRVGIKRAGKRYEQPKGRGGK